MSEGTLSLAVRPPDSRLLDDNSAVIQGVFSLSRCLSAPQLLSAGAEPCKNLLQRSFFYSCSLSQRGSQQTHSHIQSFTNLENNFSKWLGHSALFSYSFFKYFRLRPPTHLEKLTEHLTDSNAQDWFFRGCEKSHFNLQSSSYPKWISESTTGPFISQLMLILLVSWWSVTFRNPLQCPP